MSPEVDPALCGVLHTEPCRKRLRPLNPDRIDRNRFPKIKNDPLRMMGIGFAREGFGKVGITLPEGLWIIVIESRVAVIVRLVDRIAAARELVTVREKNRMDGIGSGFRGPVTLPVNRITPTSPRVPVPGLHGQFRPETVRDRAQSRPQHLHHISR